ncbi:MAG: molybdopterin-dependent oxidoreductase, partial [Solirubrobacteraceae bacterium]
MPITPRFFGERGQRRAVSLGIEPERLPPGQSPTVKWPVLSLGGTPRVSTDEWALSIDGAVQAPYVLRWEEFLALADTAWSGDIHCVTRWSKFNMDWRGAALPALIARARPTARASHLMAHCYGGYTTNLPLSDVLEHPALIA